MLTDLMYYPIIYLISKKLCKSDAVLSQTVNFLCIMQVYLVSRLNLYWISNCKYGYWVRWYSALRKCGRNSEVFFVKWGSTVVFKTPFKSIWPWKVGGLHRRTMGSKPKRKWTLPVVLRCSPVSFQGPIPICTVDWDFGSVVGHCMDA